MKVGLEGELDVAAVANFCFKDVFAGLFVVAELGDVAKADVNVVLLAKGVAGADCLVDVDGCLLFCLCAELSGGGGFAAVDSARLLVFSGFAFAVAAAGRDWGVHAQSSLAGVLCAKVEVIAADGAGLLDAFCFKKGGFFKGFGGNGGCCFFLGGYREWCAGGFVKGAVGDGGFCIIRAGSCVRRQADGDGNGCLLAKAE